VENNLRRLIGNEKSILHKIDKISESWRMKGENQRKMINKFSTKPIKKGKCGEWLKENKRK